MSVTMDDPAKLPRPRKPRYLGGEGRDPLFRMLATSLTDDLVLHLDEKRPATSHALVAPARACPFEAYQIAIHETRRDWEAFP